MGRENHQAVDFDTSLGLPAVGKGGYEPPPLPPNYFDSLHYLHTPPNIIRQIRQIGRANYFSTTVVDPDLLNTDPDPAFQVNPDLIRIKGFDEQN
jgi:hypothetical protein